MSLKWKGRGPGNWGCHGLTLTYWPRLLLIRATTTQLFNARYNVGGVSTYIIVFVFYLVPYRSRTGKRSSHFIVSYPHFHRHVPQVSLLWLCRSFTVGRGWGWGWYGSHSAIPSVCKRTHFLPCLYWFSSCLKSFPEHYSHLCTPLSPTLLSW